MYTLGINGAFHDRPIPLAMDELPFRAIRRRTIHHGGTT